MTTPTSLRTAINGRMLALCCECGNQRAFKLMRNRVFADHETWVRQVGDLKCSACGRVTRHAAVDGSDYHEQFQLRALGFTGNLPEAEANRVKDEYRQGLPRNPFLGHIWWIADQKKALKYNTRLRVHCGDLIDPPPISGASLSDTALRKPKPVRERDFDTEFEDPNTGLFWRDVDCVNCIRVSNALRLERRRKHLKVLMTTALGELLDNTQTKRYDRHVDDLIELLESVHRKT